MKDAEIASLAFAVLKDTYDLSVVSPVDEKAALAEVVADIKGLLELNDPETRQRRHRHFKIPGTCEDSYREKLFELDSSRAFIAGIRHAGGDPKLPFVNATLGFELNAQNAIEIANVITREFKAFQPQHFAVWMKPEIESAFLGKKLRPARRYLVRRISELDLTQLGSVRLELKLIRDESYYAWYEDEYRKFHESEPDLRSWVTASEKQDLETYRSQGLLYSAYLGVHLIGLIGGESQPLVGLNGVYVGELLISKEHKGKGFAVPMQREFLRKVGGNFEVVWGTIDARNLRSMRTALRVGRRPLRTECFVPLG